MALTTVDISTTFDYTVNPKLFKFEDITDYAGQSIALSSVAGCLSIVAPSGDTIYNNTNFSSPDINPDVSLENSTTIQLPLNGDGTVMTGNYTITYTVRVFPSTLVSSYDVEVEKTINFDYVTPTADVDITVNLTAPLMTSTDNTNYTVSHNGSPVNPTITRDHRLYYPATLGIAPITGTGSTLTTSTFYTQANATLVYHSELESDLEYDLGDDFYVLDSIDGYGQYDLNVDETLCNLYCGIKTLYTNWQTYKGTVRGNDYLYKLTQVTSIGVLLQAAIDCGKSDDVATYASAMREIGGFTEDCQCSNGTPVLVTGTGGSYVVVAAGTGLQVSTSTSGTTTTYTVSLTNANATKLANQYNTVVAAGSNVTVSVSTASDGTKTYTVSSTGQPNMVSGEVLITASIGNKPDVTQSFYYNYGTKFIEPAVDNMNAAGTAWQTNNNEFNVNSFFSGATSNYTVSIGDVEYTEYYAVPTLPADPALINHPYSIKVIDKNATDFTIQIVDADGIPLTGNAFDSAIATFKFNYTLIA